MGGVRDTETTRNETAIKSKKCRSCELRCKEAGKKNSSSNTPLRQKTYFGKIVLLQLFEIESRSHQPRLAVPQHGIASILEGSWHVFYPPGGYRYSRCQNVKISMWCLCQAHLTILNTFSNTMFTHISFYIFVKKKSDKSFLLNLQHKCCKFTKCIAAV